MVSGHRIQLSVIDTLPVRSRQLSDVRQKSQQVESVV
jgi:hypothetical protein